MLMKIRALHREAWQRVLFIGSILPLHPQVDFERRRAMGKESKRRKGERFISNSVLSLLHLPLHTLFSQAGLKSRKLEPNILAILNCCIMHFFQNVTKAFSSKADEIPLVIALQDMVISWECHKNAIKRHFILASGGSTLIYFDLNSFFHLCKRGT